MHLPLFGLFQLGLLFAVWSAERFLSFKLLFTYFCTMKRSVSKSSMEKNDKEAKSRHLMLNCTLRTSATIVNPEVALSKQVPDITIQLW